MGDKDIDILKVVYEKSHSSLVGPLFLIEKLSISYEEIGDRLEIMDEDGYVRVARGTYAPGMRLLNSINNVGLTAKGRHVLRNKKLILSPSSLRSPALRGWHLV